MECGATLTIYIVGNNERRVNGERQSRRATESNELKDENDDVGDSVRRRTSEGHDRHARKLYVRRYHSCNYSVYLVFIICYSIFAKISRIRGCTSHYGISFLFSTIDFTPFQLSLIPEPLLGDYPPVAYRCVRSHGE